MGVPQPPIQIRTLDIRRVDCVTWRIIQSLLDLLLGSVNHFALNLDNLHALSRLMDRSVNQVRINDSLWIERSSWFAGWHRWDQRVK